jgi:ATP-dependent DNA helicase 2 subunit 2
MPDVRRLKQQLVPSSTDVGDGMFTLLRFDSDILNQIAISALVVAIHMIETVTKKLAYTRRIILVTNGNGSLDADGLEAITTKCKDDGIELVVLYVRSPTLQRIMLTSCQWSRL